MYVKINKVELNLSVKVLSHPGGVSVNFTEAFQMRGTLSSRSQEQVQFAPVG